MIYLNKTIIETQGLRFIYSAEDASQNRPAVDGVNLSVNKGEFVAILGHNGSGKSTLAKHFNALLLPTEGVVTVNSLDTRDEANTWLIRQFAGMVFQNPDNQIIATVVEEDVAFGVENLGVEPAEIRERVDFALENLKMSEYAKQSPHFLSGGQKQRVAIAGILAMRPECIILDEPTAMLDPVGRRDVIRSVMQLNREFGITIVLITHFMDEAVQADRVIVMDNGIIVKDGTPAAIFSDVPGIKAVGLDVPQVTECAYLLRNMGVNLPDGIIGIDQMIDAITELGLGA